jgi:hypothetical protein
LHALGALQESAEKGPSIPSEPLSKNRPNPQMFLFCLAKWMFVCYDLLFMGLFCLDQEERGRGEHFFLLSKTVREALKPTKSLPLRTRSL